MVVLTVVCTTIFVARALSSISTKVEKNTTLRESYARGTGTVPMSHPQHHKSPKKTDNEKKPPWRKPDPSRCCRIMLPPGAPRYISLPITVSRSARPGDSNNKLRRARGPPETKISAQKAACMSSSSCRGGVLVDVIASDGVEDRPTC